MYLGNKPTIAWLKGHFELEVSNGKKREREQFSKHSLRIVSTFRNNKTKPNKNKKNKKITKSIFNVSRKELDQKYGQISGLSWKRTLETYWMLKQTETNRPICPQGCWIAEAFKV